MTIHIRRATNEEAKSIKEFDPFIGDRRIDNWRGELFVGVEAEAVLGYVTYSSSLFYHRPFVALLFVKESHRRRGLEESGFHRMGAIRGLDQPDSVEVFFVHRA